MSSLRKQGANLRSYLNGYDVVQGIAERFEAGDVAFIEAADMDEDRQYYVNYDGKIIDSFLYKDFVGDTLRKNYMIKVNNSNIHYILFGPVEFLFKAVSTLTSIEDESVSEATKHRYFDMLGREMLEPKGMVIRSDGKRFVYE